MSDFDGVYFDGPTAAGSAGQLDGLADRLDAALGRERDVLAVSPAGTDEVSVRAAHTMSEVGTAYTASLAGGIEELRKLAAAVRGQVHRFDRMDSDNAGEFTEVSTALR
ncbi:hypothetical protein BOX37_03990 [Nocardia mangyaensis]|uniref:PE domain-containing protein n=1 Tax=Nocardia mangyaensis TaxID=2213200 RepID=A0A1J0VML0_9NOCA|nr:PE family protein [Nocardia mangyaensis]APE33264.1 hypothetical protein BOX37_03990 [Nocardia mangyaensis]